MGTISKDGGGLERDYGIISKLLEATKEEHMFRLRSRVLHRPI
jgi:hypothetical protein